jgi:hypothetical protein
MQSVGDSDLPIRKLTSKFSYFVALKPVYSVATLVPLYETLRERYRRLASLKTLIEVVQRLLMGANSSGTQIKFIFLATDPLILSG